MAAVKLSGEIVSNMPYTSVDVDWFRNIAVQMNVGCYLSADILNDCHVSFVYSYFS